MLKHLLLKKRIKMKKENKISNHWELINDSQESIRFLESKVGFMTILIGAMIASVVERLDMIFEKYISFSVIYKISFILLIFLILICFYLIIKIIFPKQNPIENIPEPYKSYNNIYLDKITKEDKLEITNKYKEAFDSLKLFSNSLELEFLKLSYIRNLKNKYIKILTKVLIATIIVFIINISAEKYENNKILKDLEKRCCKK